MARKKRKPGMLERVVLRFLGRQKFAFQRTLCREFGLDRTTTAKLVRRLIKKGLIERERVWYRGRLTFKLFKVPDAAQRLKVLADVPCFVCRELDYCGQGGELTPVNCDKMEGWLRKGLL